MLKLQPRRERSRFAPLLTPILSLLITIVMGLALFAMLGKDPLHAMQLMIFGPFRSWFSFGELIVKATPLIVIGLGLSLGFRANVWNIGAEGQFIIGALAGGSVALAIYPVDGWWVLPLMCSAAAAAGAAWGFIPAILRIRFNANEILVSLMLSYIAVLFLSVMVAGPLRDPDGINMPESRMLQSSALLPILIEGTRAHIGIIIALVAAGVLWLLMSRHVLGFQAKLFGQAPEAAQFAGFRERSVVVSSLMISGALAGLAGVLDVSGPVGQLSDRVAMGYGFTAIIVAFLGQLHPAGVVIAGYVMAITYIGGEMVQMELGLSASIISVFQGLLLLNLLGLQFLAAYRLRWISRGGSTAETANVDAAALSKKTQGV